MAQAPNDCKFVGIMGASLGTGNRGVSALGASLIKLVVEATPDAKPIMLIGNRDSRSFEIATDDATRIVPVVNYRMSPLASPRESLFVIALLALVFRWVPLRSLRQTIINFCPWIRIAVAAQLVGDIRGGDSFSDIYGLSGFLRSCLPVMSVIWVRGSIILFPQTYGPYKNPLSRSLARYILKHAKIILSRDQESMETVRSLIGPTDKLRFCPDVAFALNAVRPAQMGIEPPLPAGTPICLVGLNVNGLMYNGGYTRRNMFDLKLDYRAFLCQLTAALLERVEVRILLVPHTFAPNDDVESDPHACREVMQSVPAELRSRVHLVTKWHDQHEIKGVIGSCDFFIGSRMHSCIAALSQEIPTIGVAYSKKFSGVFDSVGAGEWVVDGRTTTAEEAVDNILSRLDRREEMRAKLAGKPSQTLTLLHENFALLFGSQLTP